MGKANASKAEQVNDLRPDLPWRWLLLAFGVTLVLAVICGRSRSSNDEAASTGTENTNHASTSRVLGAATSSADSGRRGAPSGSSFSKPDPTAEEVVARKVAQF